MDGIHDGQLAAAEIWRAIGASIRVHERVRPRRSAVRPRALPWDWRGRTTALGIWELSSVVRARR